MKTNGAQSIFIEDLCKFAGHIVRLDQCAQLINADKIQIARVIAIPAKISLLLLRIPDLSIIIHFPCAFTVCYDNMVRNLKSVTKAAGDTEKAISKIEDTATGSSNAFSGIVGAIAQTGITELVGDVALDAR